MNNGSAVETWEHQGGTFTSISNWKETGGKKLSELEASAGYVTCTTAAGTAAKTVMQANFTISTNCRLIVKMTNYNTAASPTLNVNNTGAKPLYYNGEVVSADNTWEAGEVLDVYYDGTNYQSYNIQGGDTTKVSFNEGYGIISDISDQNFGYGGGSTVMSYSNYINCVGYKMLTLKVPTLEIGSTQGTVFYNSLKEPIKSNSYAIENAGKRSVKIVSLNIPKNAVFFRTTFFTDTDTYGEFRYELLLESESLFIDGSEDLNNDVIFIDNQILLTNPINENYGNTEPYTGVSTTDYLNIPPDCRDITISTYRSNINSISGCVIYDSEKNPIKSYRYQYREKTDTFVTAIHNISANAAYIRTTIYTKDKGNFVYKINSYKSSGVAADLEKEKSLYVLNAKDYGIKDGGNCKYIIYAMLEDILQDFGRGIIYVPGGTYILEEVVYWKSNVKLVGDGEGVTVFKPKGANSAFRNNNEELENIGFENITIDGELQNDSSYSAMLKAIYFQKVKNATFKNLEIKNTYSTGLGVDFFINGIIENIRCDNCGRGADLNANTAPGASGIGVGTGGYKRGNETLVISNCHCNNCKQYGIFVETQTQENGGTPYGTIIIGCTAEGNRTGFGVSGTDSVSFIGCSAYKNYHAGFSYDDGTMGLQSIGKRPKFISCIAVCNGIGIPEGYPEYRGQENGFGWYILSNYSGIELIGCNAIGNLKSGIEIVDGISKMNIDGGEISENKENGINLNGNITSFRISPTVIANNIKSGIRLNGSLSHGLITGINICNNDIGIEKTETANMNDSLVKDNFVYNNTTRNNDLDS